MLFVVTVIIVVRSCGGIVCILCSPSGDQLPGDGKSITVVDKLMD